MRSRLTTDDLPVANGHLGTVASRHFGGIGLDLMAASPAPGEAAWLPEGEAPDDEPNTGSRRTAERHRHLCRLGVARQAADIELKRG
jgi:hypothetical protein